MRSASTWLASCAAVLCAARPAPLQDSCRRVGCRLDRVTGGCFSHDGSPCHLPTVEPPPAKGRFCVDLYSLIYTKTPIHSRCGTTGAVDLSELLPGLFTTAQLLQSQHREQTVGNHGQPIRNNPTVPDIHWNSRHHRGSDTPLYLPSDQPWDLDQLPTINQVNPYQVTYHSPPSRLRRRPLSEDEMNPYSDWENTAATWRGQSPPKDPYPLPRVLNRTRRDRTIPDPERTWQHASPSEYPSSSTHPWDDENQAFDRQNSEGDHDYPQRPPIYPTDTLDQAHWDYMSQYPGTKGSEGADGGSNRSKYSLPIPTVDDRSQGLGRKLPEDNEETRSRNQGTSDLSPYPPPHPPYPPYSDYYPPPPNYGPVNNYYNHISPSYEFNSVTNRHTKPSPFSPDEFDPSNIPLPNGVGFVDNSSGKDSTDNRGSNGGTYVGANNGHFLDKGATRIGTDSRGYQGHFSDSRGTNSHGYSDSDSRGRQTVKNSGGSRGRVAGGHSMVTTGEKASSDDEDVADVLEEDATEEDEHGTPAVASPDQLTDQTSNFENKDTTEANGANGRASETAAEAPSKKWRLPKDDEPGLSTLGATETDFW
ncbi:hypothetical protein XA68_12334 [Ophiocordyceps unilateralis]|uniref:Extracellular membrane protein CFEM domain-containing protein n=1 Tax=Ophiocordyceps unilateralis TaxID=268505 RepID=A0A2A9PUJ0_OPHUN|nr:hypothetical protein XA68_12334 [Ophiocordyceps unilateralis]